MGRPVGWAAFDPRETSAMPLTVLGLSGSLRAGSLNTALLRALADAAAVDVEVVVAPPLELPLFNADEECLPQPEVDDLVARVASADAVVIASPEYNHGITGVLKNALDWLSRGDRPLQGMPVAMVGTSPGPYGSARGQLQLRTVLSAMGAAVLAAPTVTVPRGTQQFDDDLRLTSDTVRRHLGSTLRRLLEQVPADDREDANGQK